jgi:hypothetical protein
MSTEPSTTQSPGTDGQELRHEPSSSGVVSLGDSANGRKSGKNWKEPKKASRLVLIAVPVNNHGHLIMSILTSNMTQKSTFTKRSKGKEL